MTTPSLDEVLHRVAAGELSPEAALALMEPAAGPAPTDPPSPLTVQEPPVRAGSSDDDAPPVWGTPAGGRPLHEGGPATVVRINASYRSLDVIADPTVAEAAVTGTHSVRREGGALVVDTLENPFGGNGEPGDERGSRFSFADLPRGLAWARSWKEHHLVVRVNPELAVEIDAAGANVRLSGLDGGAKLRLIASAVKLERVRGPLDIDAMSSSVKGFAAPTGRSRIVCESSSVKLIFGAESDVHVRARNRMGKVVLPTAVSKGGLVDPDMAETRFGAGTGEMTVEAVMSSVMLAGDTGTGTGGDR